MVSPDDKKQTDSDLFKHRLVGVGCGKDKSRSDEEDWAPGPPGGGDLTPTVSLLHKSGCSVLECRDYTLSLLETSDLEPGLNSCFFFFFNGEGSFFFFFDVDHF